MFGILLRLFHGVVIKFWKGSPEAHFVSPVVNDYYYYQLRIQNFKIFLSSQLTRYSESIMFHCMSDFHMMILKFSLRVGDCSCHVDHGSM